MVKKEHYIPQFYLKRFGDGEKIDAYDIQNQKYIPNTNALNFASKRFFYDIEQEKLKKHNEFLKSIFNTSFDKEENTIDSQYVERILSRIESNMSDSLDKLEQDYSLIENEKFLSSLFLFLRTLSIRTVGYRNMLSEIANQKTEWLKSLNIKKYDDIYEDLSSEEIAKINQLEYILSIPETLKKSISFFENYNIFIGRNNTNLGFIISDEPFYHFELGFNDICFPVNRSLAIIMQVKDVDSKYLICTKKPDANNTVNLDIKDVIKYNTFQNNLISRYLFGKMSDIKYFLKISSVLNNLNL